MPESTINAIITAIGSLLGGIIGAYATIQAAKKGSNDKETKSPLVLGIVAGTFIGAVAIVAVLALLGFISPKEIVSVSDESFTGTWQGLDSYDGSTITISLVQTGNEITGTYSDSYSQNVNPPGFYGKGSGIVLSSTSAHIVFNLSRWDGKTITYELNLIYSNQGNTLTILDGAYKTVMQKR